MVRSILEQTGWKRPHPQQICQEMDVLLQIREFDFDMRQPAFRDYLRVRGIWDIDGAVWGVEDPDPDCLQMKVYKDCPSFQIAFYQDWSEEQVFRDLQPLRPDLYRMTDKDRHSNVRLWKITRGKCQDAWELFNGVSAAAADESNGERQLDLFAA